METVIQEIANQLGMAVDQAGQFIAEQLPNFAEMKAMQAAIPMIVVWSIFGVLAAVSLVSLGICVYSKRRNIKLQKEDIYGYYDTDLDDFNSFGVFIFFGIWSIVFIITGIITTGICAPELIGWQNYPEAMLINMALKAVG